MTGYSYPDAAMIDPQFRQLAPELLEELFAEAQPYLRVATINDIEVDIDCSKPEGSPVHTDKCTMRLVTMRPRGQASTHPGRAHAWPVHVSRPMLQSVVQRVHDAAFVS